MSPIPSPASSDISPSPAKPTINKARWWLLKGLLLVVLVIPVVFVWQALTNSINNTDPLVAGQPLSNPKTHLHLVALGGTPGVVYLGTHYGLFTSTDGGQTWPQPRGVLNTLMILDMAINPTDPQALAVIGRSSSGLTNQDGMYFSANGGNLWQLSNAPAGLSPSAYLFHVQAGSGSAGHFYAFYEYAGWYETTDLGMHWHLITTGTLSNMLTPTLLTDPSNPNHLMLGGDQGLFETHNDGHSWNQLPAIQGNVQSIVASTTTPRLIFCVTDQSIYRWREGSSQMTQLTHLPLPSLPSRLVLSADGTTLYGLTGQDLWASHDSGTTWKHLWQFDRSDLVSLVIDPQHPRRLYAGFFMPGKVIASTNGGTSWHSLTA